jgi:hypothetical protein
MLSPLHQCASALAHARERALDQSQSDSDKYRLDDARLCVGAAFALPQCAPGELRQTLPCASIHDSSGPTLRSLVAAVAAIGQQLLSRGSLHRRLLRSDNSFFHEDRFTTRTDFVWIEPRSIFQALRFCQDAIKASFAANTVLHEDSACSKSDRSAMRVVPDVSNGLPPHYAARSLCFARDIASCHSCESALKGIFEGAGRAIRKYRKVSPA